MDCQGFEKWNGAGLFLALIGLCLVAGCGQTETIPKATAPAAAAAVPPDRLWHACQDELQRRGYVPDYMDRHNGVIQTYPLVSKQWFELWRDDVGSGQGLLESSLQTQRRTVYLTVQPGEGLSYGLDCRVEIEKQVYAPRDHQGTVRGEDIFGFSPGRTVLRGLSDRDNERPYEWAPAGRDGQLEERMINSIRNGLSLE